jgi:hypothetical protein
MIDDRKLIELWKTPYSERFKYVKYVIEDEIIPMYSRHINQLTSLIEVSVFKMLKAEHPNDIYEAISRLNGALIMLESLVDSLTNDVTKVLTVVLAPKTVIPPELVKS